MSHFIVINCLTVFISNDNLSGTILSTKKHDYQSVKAINLSLITRKDLIVLFNQPAIVCKVVSGYPRNSDSVGVSTSGILHCTIKCVM